MANTDSATPRLNLAGDAPKKSVQEDEFGLVEIARAIARVVRDRSSTNGYAIGIEGRWGSGKTTLLNFIGQLLSQESGADQKIIRFDPWLIGSKQALISAFFEELAERVDELRNDPSLREKVGGDGKSALNRLSRNVQRYAKYINVAATTVSGASALAPSLSVKVAAFSFSALSSISTLFNRPPPTLETLKDKIVGDLRVITKLAPDVRITVLIDDTDRLEPQESVEILRLIKAVANFPLVTYLVCFDMAILSAQVREIVRVGDGEDYLEKIFQQIIPIPPQEPFALRRFVRKRLAEYFPVEMASTEPHEFETNNRQDAVFDKWAGKLIETPRDAIRVCENVKFGWSFLSEKGDFLDYVWLQIVKLKLRPLYEWTRDYVTGLGAFRDGGRPSDGEPVNEATRLKVILEKLGWGKAPDRSDITVVLPGLKSVLLEGANSAVFKFAPEDELAQFEAQRRLGSPSHWRYYFAYEKPSYAIDDADLIAFRKLATLDRPATAQFLRDMAGKRHQTSGFFLDVLLDRLKDQSRFFSTEEQVGMAWAFSDMMDELPRGGPRHFTDIDPWRKAVRLLGAAVGPHFTDIVSEGSSINWLAIAMRDQGFALGMVNQDRSAPDRQWLTVAEFKSALAAIIQRFRVMGLDAIFALPEPAQVLFCWEQLGDDSKELKRLIFEQTRGDDDMFIRALGAMRSWVDSSDKGFYNSLQPEIVSYFFDVGDVLERLKKIAEQDSAPELKSVATSILAVMDKQNFERVSAGQKIPQ